MKKTAAWISALSKSFKETYACRTLVRINWISGLVRLSVVVFILSTVKFSFFFLKHRQNHSEIRIEFNEEEEAACLSDIIRHCRPEMLGKIKYQSTDLHISLSFQEHRFLEFIKARHLTPQTIMSYYNYKYQADLNGGYVFKFYIPQYGIRSGRVSAPAEIEPYIQSAVNRKIDECSYIDFSGGGVIGELQKGTCIYKDFYLAKNKLSRSIDDVCCFLLHILNAISLSVVLPISISIFVVILFLIAAFIESITKWIFRGFRDPGK